MLLPRAVQVVQAASVETQATAQAVQVRILEQSELSAARVVRVVNATGVDSLVIVMLLQEQLI
jgi:hypothetical protein